jgi:hypothetical protein
MAKTNPKVLALKVLIEYKDVTSFGQIFRKKHFTVAEMAKLIGKSPVYLKKCIDDPGHFQVRDLVRIAEALDLERKQTIEIVMEDYWSKLKS